MKITAKIGYKNTVSVDLYISKAQSWEILEETRDETEIHFIRLAGTDSTWLIDEADLSTIETFLA